MSWIFRHKVPLLLVLIIGLMCGEMLRNPSTTLELKVFAFGFAVLVVLAVTTYIELQERTLERRLHI